MTTLIAMAIMNIGFGVAVAGVIASGCARRWWRSVGALFQVRAVRRLAWTTLGLGTACVVSLVHGLWHPYTLAGHSVEIHLARDSLKIWYLVLPFSLAAAILLLGDRDRARLTRTWVAFAAILSVVGISQYFYGWSWMRSRVIPVLDPHRFHVDLWMGHHLSVASILIFPFFCAMDTWFRRRRWFDLLAGALIGTALILTFSRMLWFALMVGLVLYGGLSLRGRWRWLAALGVVLGASLVFSVPALKRHLFHNSGRTDREVLWAGNLHFFKERPLLGIGFRQNEEMSYPYIQYSDPKAQWIFSGHAHNNFLEMLGGTGLIGAALWVLWNALALGLMIRLMRNRNANSDTSDMWVRGLFVAWVVFHINGITQVNFWEGKVAHQLMWSLAWLLVWARAAAPKSELS